MKLIFSLLVLSCSLAFAQEVDYNKIILPDRIQGQDLPEKLVQLAWKNHPTNEVLRRQLAIAQYEVRGGAANWLDMITIQGNLNEFNIDQRQNDENAVPTFFPRYNFGLRIPLGIFITNSVNAKQNRELVSIAESELNAKKLEIRSVVLKAYNDYLYMEQVLKIQTQQFSDTESNFKLAEQRFKRGEITFDAYSTFQNNVNLSTIRLLDADRNFKNAKLDIEQLIGIRLEDVQ
jgi:outer membrane protein TolC